MKIGFNNVKTILPGLLLCATVTVAAALLEHVQTLLVGRVWLEGIVLAIILGTLLRSLGGVRQQSEAGIHFSAKFLLELAVTLLGASVNAHTLLENGPALIAGIVLVVLVTIPCGYAIGCLMGLPRQMAMLVACGISICGNSAIAAVAPVIAADSKDVTSSITFTAVLGLVVVVGLPVMAPLLSMSHTQFGIFAGLTVYAVPQVLAATAPVALSSFHIGTLVKLVRVLMLGPVVLSLSVWGRKDSQSRPPVHHLVPWFIVGFLLLMALRSAGCINDAVIAPVKLLSSVLTIMSMAALGLGVDMRSVLRVGKKMAGVVVLTMLVLGVVSYMVVRLLATV